MKRKLPQSGFMFGWSSVYIFQFRRSSQKKSVPLVSRKSFRVYLLFRVIRKGHFISERLDILNFRCSMLDRSVTWIAL